MHGDIKLAYRLCKTERAYSGTVQGYVTENKLLYI